MNEIIPGIYHWTAAHPKIKIEVSSYYLADECVLDYVGPSAGASIGPPTHLWQSCAGRTGHRRYDPAMGRRPAQPASRFPGQAVVQERLPVLAERTQVVLEGLRLGDAVGNTLSPVRLPNPSLR